VHSWNNDNSLIFFPLNKRSPEDMSPEGMTRQFNLFFPQQHVCWKNNKTVYSFFPSITMSPEKKTNKTVYSFFPSITWSRAMALVTYTTTGAGSY
jgi:hypothetical protein